MCAQVEANSANIEPVSEWVSKPTEPAGLSPEVHMYIACVCTVGLSPEVHMYIACVFTVGLSPEISLECTVK